ncbi:uncharacterized protein METZ01_LOCUS451400, partial [marine metagenome]
HHCGQRPGLRIDVHRKRRRDPDCLSRSRRVLRRHWQHQQRLQHLHLDPGRHRPDDDNHLGHRRQRLRHQHGGCRSGLHQQRGDHRLHRGRHHRLRLLARKPHGKHHQGLHGDLHRILRGHTDGLGGRRHILRRPVQHQQRLEHLHLDLRHHRTDDRSHDSRCGQLRQRGRVRGRRLRRRRLRIGSQRPDRDRGLRRSQFHLHSSVRSVHLHLLHIRPRSRQQRQRGLRQLEPRRHRHSERRRRCRQLGHRGLRLN